VSASLLFDLVVSREFHTALVFFACLAYVAMVAAESRWGGLSIRLVALTTVGSCLAAVAVFPRETGDLYWYAIYGRVVSAYHASPYTHVPAAFPHDPLLQITGHGWAHVPSVYGPLFTLFSAVASPVVGVAELPTRLLYQGVATIALLVACVVIWRRTRSPGAVAFLAANPVIAIYIVNGGHNDILVGLAMLGALVLSGKGHDTAAGVVGGLGALVKLTGVVGIVALAAATYATRGRDAARRLSVAAFASVAGGYLVAGPAAVFAPMRTAGVAYSSASVWQTLNILNVQLPAPHVALALLAVLTLLVIFAFAGDPVGSVTASLTTLTLGAAYMLPGYVAWALPSASLDHRSRISRVAAAEGVVLVASYEVVRHPISGPVGEAIVDARPLVAPVAVLVLLAIVVSTALQRRLSVRRVDRADDLVGSRRVTAQVPVPERGGGGVDEGGFGTTRGLERRRML